MAPTPSHARSLTKDTQLCISLSGMPSNVGTRFHNYLYAALGLDFVYKAIATTDLPGAVTGIRAFGIRGAGISMPFKQAIVPLLDSLDESASSIGAVNSVVNTGGRLRGYNTDYIAVSHLLARHRVPTDASVAVRGSGGIASAVVAALRDRQFSDVTVVARNPETGPTLADRFGARWTVDLAGAHPEVLINATPIGMGGTGHADEMPFPDSAVLAADLVFDVVAVPAETPFVRRARDLGLKAATGADVIALQATEQFALYTGVRPPADLVEQAAAYSHA